MNFHRAEHGQGLPHDNWQSGTGRFSQETFTEKQDPQHTKFSKRSIWRFFRLGASLALTIAALVLTLIILVAGRHGGGSSDLSLITVRLNK